MYGSGSSAFARRRRKKQLLQYIIGLLLVVDTSGWWLVKSSCSKPRHLDYIEGDVHYAVATPSSMLVIDLVEMLGDMYLSRTHSHTVSFRIFTYESWPISRPVSVATSPAFPGRPIGRANGLDLPFPGHFAKKSSDFTEINPQSNLFS